MKIYILLLTIGSCLFSQFCQGQECQSVQRIDAKDGVAYMGIVSIPTSTTVTGNHLFTLMLAKSIIKTDTTYQLSIGMNASGIAGTAPPKGIILQFEDGSKIDKPNQPVDVMPMSHGIAVLTAEVALTSDEIRQLKNKSLVNISLASSKVIMLKSISQSVQAVASCLPITW